MSAAEESLQTLCDGCAQILSAAELKEKLKGGKPLRVKLGGDIGRGIYARVGMVFKSRRPTGEVLPVNAPGRDPIVTRILWLKGLETQNANAQNRFIYIHGTPEEKTIGRPTSFGCIRMRSRDVAELYEIVGVGAKVEVNAEGAPRPVARFATKEG